jgi:hypothetical protein
MRVLWIFVLVSVVVILFSNGCGAPEKRSESGNRELVHPLHAAVDLISEGDEISRRALNTYYPKSRRDMLLIALDRYASARLILLKELKLAAFDYQRERIAKLLQVVEACEESAILSMPLPPRHP